MANIKLTEKQTAVFNYLKENGRVTMDELCNALELSAKSLNPVITTMGCKGEKAKGLVDYEKVEVEGQEKPTKYVFLTEAGLAFDPAAVDAE
jgi:DNA-binding MarR family transcriptional regulator